MKRALALVLVLGACTGWDSLYDTCRREGRCGSGGGTAGHGGGSTSGGSGGGSGGSTGGGAAGGGGALPACMPAEVPDAGPGASFALVQDSETSRVGSTPGFSFFAGASRAYLSLDDGVHGLELWSSDGTATGTRGLIDFNPGPSSSQSLVMSELFGQPVFFDQHEFPRRVYLLTDAGCPTVLATMPSPSDSLYAAPVVGGRVVVGPWVNGSVSHVLYSSDGTAAGTRVLAPVSLGLFARLGEQLFFGGVDDAGAALWATDGLDAGIVRRFSMTSPFGVRPLGALNGKLLLAVDDPPTGSALWASDGTAAGTALVADLHDGGSAWVAELAVLGGVAYFIGSTAETGRELFKTNGSSIELVADLTPGPGDSLLEQLTPQAGRLWFFKSFELWVTDGTPGGTRQVPFPLPGTSLNTVKRLGSKLLAIVAIPGVAQGTPASLYAFDADGGAVRLVDPALDGVEAAGPLLWVTDANAFFPCRAGGGSGARVRVELCITDGTATGHVLKEVSERNARGLPPLMPIVPNGDRVLYFGMTAAAGAEPWVSDGTDPGTHLVRDLSPGSGNSVTLGSAGPIVYGGDWYFISNSSGGNELWRTDGTFANTRRVIDLNPGPGSGIALPATFSVQAQPYFVALGRLYFRGNDGQHGVELWSTDGTAAGTAMVADLRTGPDSALPVQGFAARMTVTLGRLFVPADDDTARAVFEVTDAGMTRLGPYTRVEDLAAVGSQLYVNGGSALRLLELDGGLTTLADLGDGGVVAMMPGATLLYFVAATGPEGKEVWVTDGTPAGTRMLAVYPGPADGIWPDLYDDFTTVTAVVGDVLYFRGFSAAHGLEPWVSDSTMGGTRELKDLTPGPESSAPKALVPFRGRVHFIATTPEFGAEVWATDGTSTGTVRLSDIAPGRASAFDGPVYTSPTTKALFWSADDYARGFELWKYEPP